MELAELRPGGFDAALAQLVVHFLTDPVARLREMARVTRPGGVVAGCVWDHAGHSGPLSTFWQAVNGIDPGAHDESDLAEAREGHHAELFETAGLTDIEPSKLTVRNQFATFDECWEPYTFGAGPAREYVAKLDEAGRDVLRSRCADRLPPAPLEVNALGVGSRTTGLGSGTPVPLQVPERPRRCRRSSRFRTTQGSHGSRDQ